MHVVHVVVHVAVHVVHVAVHRLAEMSCSLLCVAYSFRMLSNALGMVRVASSCS